MSCACIQKFSMTGQLWGLSAPSVHDLVLPQVGLVWSFRVSKEVTTTTAAPPAPALPDNEDDSLAPHFRDEDRSHPHS